MALKKQMIIKSNFGDDVIFNNAYIKVVALSGNKQLMRIEVGTHKDVNAPVVDRQQYYFAPDLDGKNFIAQAYEHLKTLPEFAGAIDC
jgi:hypothetical protein